MAFDQQRGQVGKTENLGKIIYLTDGTSFFPVEASTAANSTMARQIISQREPFIFRPGSTALADGMVASGTRSASGTITTGTVANSTYWGSWVPYSPLRGGRIDGLSSGGIFDGQITIGTKLSAGTGTVKLTARIANTANTGSPTTMLTLTGTITCTTAETFQTYDIPYLACNTVFNSVPFSFAIGGDMQQASSSAVFRIMESSYIQGEMEPGT